MPKRDDRKHQKAMLDDFVDMSTSASRAIGSQGSAMPFIAMGFIGSVISLGIVLSLLPQKPVVLKDTSKILPALVDGGEGAERMPPVVGRQ